MGVFFPFVLFSVAPADSVNVNQSTPPPPSPPGSIYDGAGRSVARGLSHSLLLDWKWCLSCGSLDTERDVYLSLTESDFLSLTERDVLIRWCMHVELSLIFFWGGVDISSNHNSCWSFLCRNSKNHTSEKRRNLGRFWSLQNYCNKQQTQETNGDCISCEARLFVMISFLSCWLKGTSRPLDCLTQIKAFVNRRSIVFFDTFPSMWCCLDSFILLPSIFHQIAYYIPSSRTTRHVLYCFECHSNSAGICWHGLVTKRGRVFPPHPSPYFVHSPFVPFVNRCLTFPSLFNLRKGSRKPEKRLRSSNAPPSLVHAEGELICATIPFAFAHFFHLLSLLSLVAFLLTLVRVLSVFICFAPGSWV